MQPNHPNMDCRKAREEERKESTDLVLCSDDFSSVWNSWMFCEWTEKVVEQSGCYRTFWRHFGTGMKGERKAYKNLLRHPDWGSRFESKAFRIAREPEYLCLSPHIFNTFQQTLHHKYANIRIYRTVRNCHILSFNEETTRQVGGRTSPLWPACVHLGAHWVSLYQQEE
jgi:hypothetical protein